MAFFSWLKLHLQEQQLYHGAFGKYNRYRRYCIERDAKTTKEKLAVATEVLCSSDVSSIEAHDNELYLLSKARELVYGTESHKLQSLADLTPTGERAPTAERTTHAARSRIGTVPEAHFGTESHRVHDISSFTLQAN